MCPRSSLPCSADSAASPTRTEGRTLAALLIPSLTAVGRPPGRFRRALPRLVRKTSGLPKPPRRSTCERCRSRGFRPRLRTGAPAAPVGPGFDSLGRGGARSRAVCSHEGNVSPREVLRSLEPPVRIGDPPRQDGSDPTGLDCACRRLPKRLPGRAAGGGARRRTGKSCSRGAGPMKSRPLTNPPRNPREWNPAVAELRDPASLDDPADHLIGRVFFRSGIRDAHENPVRPRCSQDGIRLRALLGEDGSVRARGEWPGATRRGRRIPERRPRRSARRPQLRPIRLRERRLFHFPGCGPAIPASIRERSSDARLFSAPGREPKAGLPCPR